MRVVVALSIRWGLTVEQTLAQDPRDLATGLDLLWSEHDEQPARDRRGRQMSG